jgi:iron complex transport system ATP-binding protein
VAVALHDLNAAANHASDAVFLKAGRIVSAGPAAALLTPAEITRVFEVDVEELTSPTGHRLFAFHRVAARHDRPT